MNLAQISSSVIFITAITFLTSEKLNNSNIINDIRLPNYVIPLHYSIKLRTFFKDDDFYMMNLRNTEEVNFVFYGESSTTINIHISTQNISLHTLNLNINELKIKMIKSDSTIYELKEFSHDLTMSLSNLYFVDVLSPGLYTLKMEFTSRIITDDNVEKTLFRSNYTNKKNMTLVIVPHVQTIGVQLFPWDEPNLRTTFTISVKHHRNLVILSNMPVRTHNITLHEELMWTHFHTTPPLSTYQVSIVITNFYRVHVTMTVSLWCAKCSKQHYIKFAQQVMKNITLHLESEFKEIKIPKIDHVAIPNFPYNSISKWGLIFHREVDVIYNEKLDPIMRKMEIAHLIALKVAYQWLGNVVGPSWWSDLWLHGGLATLYGEEAIAKTCNISWMGDLFIVQNQYESLHLDSYFNLIHPQINNLSETDSIFSFYRYMKAPIVLRMLQGLITDEDFQKGVHAYLHMYMFGSVTLHFFWDTMQKEVNKITNESMDDIIESFTTWIAYVDYPIVNIKQDYNSFIMSQKDFNILDNKKWWIPLNYVMQKTLESTRVWLIAQEPYLRILSADRDSWIIINFEQTAGYYRVNYESENWHKIASYLNAGGYKNISVISRAKIVDDAFHFIMAGQLNISIFWALTKYLSQETNYVAWYPMIKVIEHMSSMFPFSRYDISFINDIKGKLSELLKKPLQTLGLKKRATEDNLTESLRQEIAKWACTLALSECMEMAKRKLREHLSNPEKYKILPEWKEWTYCNGLKIAEYPMWNNVTNIWLKKSDHQLLPFLACCRYRFMTAEYLPSLVSERFTKYEMQHVAIIRSYIKTFHSIIARHANHYNFLKNILLNWEKIKPEFYTRFDTSTFLTIIINHIYSENLLHEIPRLLRNVKYIKKEQMLKIQHKIKTRSSEIKNLINYFQVIDIDLMDVY